MSIINTRRTATEAVQASIARYHETEERIQAFQWFDEANALKEAEFQDQRDDDAPLQGLVIGIKDLVNTAGIPSGYGSPIYADNRPDEDAPIVQQLREAGAVPFGKTVTTEFALFNPPKTRNPWNLERTPGGSSSGSAAAVAAGVFPIALGTQTAGSVVRPAAFCGVFGFKPSFDELSAVGLKSISPSLDTVGLIANNLEDICTVFNAVRQNNTGSANTVQECMRIDFMRTPWWQGVNEEIRDHLEEVSEKLAKHSDVFSVQGSKYNTVFGELTTAQQALMGAEVFASLTAERTQHLSELSGLLRNYLEQAEKADPSLAAQARSMIDCVKDRPELVFGEADLILSPATLTEAPTPETTGDPLLCRAWTALGIPCISLPTGFSKNGMPIAIQVAARPGCDDLLLEAAKRIMNCLGIHEIATPALNV